MSDEGYNVKDIIKGNIASARKDAARLKRPRDPQTGKPPEMGSGFMQKRKDAADKIKAGRKELARQTENFITRTVGILVDRIEELKQSTMQSAADKREKQAQDLTKAAAAARSVGAKQANADLAKVAGTATAGASRIKAGMRTREKGQTATKPSERIGRKEIAASNRKTRQSQERLGMREPVKTPKKEATENFIGKTVEILAEKLIGNQHEIDADGDKKITKKDFKMLRKGKRKDEATENFINKTVDILAERMKELLEYDAKGVAAAAIGQARRGAGSTDTKTLDTANLTYLKRPGNKSTIVVGGKGGEGATTISKQMRSGRTAQRTIQPKPKPTENK